MIMMELSKVMDPEIGVPITEMNLIDDISIVGNEVTVKYHLTMPFCPPIFALSIGKDIKNRVLSINDVKKVTVVLSDHQMSDEINKRINLDEK
ncbi:MAG TPA: iron-sulfur cluster assembly protein [Nitrososphaerales archaeon]